MEHPAQSLLVSLPWRAAVTLSKKLKPDNDMKKMLLLLTLVSALITARAADVITLWNFNSSPADANLNTGTLTPSTGSGIVTFIGGVTNSFLGGHTTDPANAGGDNTAINSGNYPASGTGDKTAGQRFALSTVGYQNITISLAFRVSNTGSRFWRVQYSTDGVNFLDSTNVITVTSGGSYSTKTADLSYIPGVTNNPNFAFQIMAEFSNGTNYTAAANGSTYGQGGVVRTDMMIVSGDILGVFNNPPTISTISNVTMRVDTTTNDIPFTIGDVETAAASLTLVKGSSNPTLIPTSGIVFGGSDSNRTVTITPAAGQIGVSLLTVGVVDEGGKSNNVNFTVTVLPTNTPPTMTVIANQSTVSGVATAAIPFTISDLETAAGALTVTGASANLTLLPLSGIQFGGSGSNRTVTLTPAAGQVGSVLVTVTTSDGFLSTNRSFVLTVVPSAGTLLYEPFDYANGSLITNSAFLWNNHSGTFGQLSIITSNLYLTSDNSEDVNAPLRGEPYTVASGTNLYFSFFYSAEFLPSIVGDYLAHLKDNASTFRARLTLSTLNAAIGSYRIGIGNGNGTATNAGYAEVPTDFNPGQTNRIVVRYNVGTGLSTVWVNPVSEASTGYTATDVLASTNNVTQFAFRESNFIGTGFADEVRVAVTFNEAIGILPSPAASLRIFKSGPDVIVAWPTSATGFVLQSCDNLTTTNWQNVLTVPAVVGSENFVTNATPTGNAFFRLKN